MTQNESSRGRHLVKFEGVHDLFHFSFANDIVVGEGVGEYEIALEGEGYELGIVGCFGIDGGSVGHVEDDGRGMDIAQYVGGDARGAGTTVPRSFPSSSSDIVIISPFVDIPQSGLSSRLDVQFLHLIGNFILVIVAAPMSQE